MVVRVRRTAHGYGVGVKGTHLLLGAVVTVPFLLGAAAGVPDAADEVAFRFTDPDIVESSGLVAVDGLVVTTNDSGDSGRVFTVDPATGATVGVTTWPTDPEDVEALAPAGPGHVWVADIGDNQHARASVSVLRVPVGRGDRDVVPEAYELVYPDGARDAEALVSHPVTGQLFLVTKGVFAGTVYAAPQRLRADRPNRLTEVGQAPGIVTDATFLPGGGGVVMRTYSDGPPVGVPVVAGRRVVAAARPGPGRGRRPRRGRAAGQHRGSPLPGAPGRPAGVGRRDRPALARVDEPALARDGVRPAAARWLRRDLRRGPRRARPGRAASCRGRPAARRRPA